MERRRHARLHVELPAEWHKGGERHEATASSLSEGGCFLETRPLPALRERVRVTIHLSTVTSLTMAAEVVHLTESGMGVSFVDQADEQRALLARAWADLARSAPVAPLRT